MTALHVPELPAGCSTLDAAQGYAGAGWFVLPLDPAAKHAGSLVGRGWPQQSSRDPATIARWWQRWPDAALALHVGRSGAVAFDVDTPAAMPAILRAAIAEHLPPFQSTRADDPERGHYLFAAAPGRFGNSTGDLGIGWGDVRGLNGILVVAPTPHSKAHAGGRYAWQRSGALPALPDELAVLLRPPGSSRGRVDDAAVLTFLLNLPDGEPCDVVTQELEELPTSGRHGEILGRTQRLARFGEQGHHGAGAALEELQDAFVLAVESERQGGADEAVSEYTRALSGAVAAVLAEPTPAAGRGCCGANREPDWLRDMGERNLAAKAAAQVVPAQVPALSLVTADDTAPLVALPRPRSRLHANVLDLSVFRGELPPSPPYVLDDLVREGDLVALVSAAKAGKSLLTLDRVLTAVVAGRRVVYLDAENGLRDIHARAHALGHAESGALRGDGLVYTTFPSVALDQPAGAAEFVAFIEELHAERPVDLVVLDTASRFLAGEENDAGPWLQMYRLALQPLKRAGIAVLRLDHLGKDTTKGARGSSAKSGDVDAVIELQAAQPDALTRTQAVELTVTMQRSGLYETHQTLVRGVIGGVLGHRLVGSVAGGNYIVSTPQRPADDIIAALDKIDAPAATGRRRGQELLGLDAPRAGAAEWAEARRRRMQRTTSESPEEAVPVVLGVVPKIINNSVTEPVPNHSEPAGTTAVETELSQVNGVELVPNHSEPPMATVPAEPVSPPYRGEPVRPSEPNSGEATISYAPAMPDEPTIAEQRPTPAGTSVAPPDTAPAEPATATQPRHPTLAEMLMRGAGLSREPAERVERGSA